MSSAKRPTAPPHHWWKCHSPCDDTGAQPHFDSAATPGVAPQGCVAPNLSVVLSTAAVAYDTAASAVGSSGSQSWRWYSR